MNQLRDVLIRLRCEEVVNKVTITQHFTKNHGESAPNIVQWFKSRKRGKLSHIDEALEPGQMVERVS